MEKFIWTKHVGRGFFTGPILAGLLAGCGGGSATTPMDTPMLKPTSSTEAAMQSAQAAMISDYSPIEYTPLALIPVSGSAVYDGYLSGNLLNSNDGLTDTIIDEMSLTVGFTNSSVNVLGSASNFRDEDVAPMTGILTFSNRDLDRGADITSDITLKLNANGTLTDADENDLIFGTQVQGDMLGTDYNAVGGFVYGVVTHNGAEQNIDGKFIAER